METLAKHAGSVADFNMTHRPHDRPEIAISVTFQLPAPSIPSWAHHTMTIQMRQISAGFPNPNPETRLVSGFGAKV